METLSTFDNNINHKIISSRNSLNLDHCKYCLQSQLENQSKFVNPCRCTNPVCISCLQKHLETNGLVVCEICTNQLIITPEMGINFEIKKVRFVDSVEINIDDNEHYSDSSFYTANDSDSNHDEDNNNSENSASQMVETFNSTTSEERVVDINKSIAGKIDYVDHTCKYVVFCLVIAVIALAIIFSTI